jgi:hypothetical protein
MGWAGEHAQLAQQVAENAYLDGGGNSPRWDAAVHRTGDQAMMPEDRHSCTINLLDHSFDELRQI